MLGRFKQQFPVDEDRSFSMCVGIIDDAKGMRTYERTKLVAWANKHRYIRDVNPGFASDRAEINHR